MKKILIAAALFLSLLLFGCPQFPAEPPDTQIYDAPTAQALATLQAHYPDYDFAITNSSPIYDYYFWENPNCAVLVGNETELISSREVYFYVLQFSGPEQMGVESIANKTANRSLAEDMFAELLARGFARGNHCNVSSATELGFRQFNGTSYSFNLPDAGGLGCHLYGGEAYFDDSGKLLITNGDMICVD